MVKRLHKHGDVIPTQRSVVFVSEGVTVVDRREGGREGEKSVVIGAWLADSHASHLKLSPYQNTKTPYTTHIPSDQPCLLPSYNPLPTPTQRRRSLNPPTPKPSSNRKNPGILPSHTHSPSSPTPNRKRNGPPTKTSSSPASARAKMTPPTSV